MVSNTTFIIIALFVISLAYVAPFAGLILSIALSAFKVAFLYINQDDFTDV